MARFIFNIKYILIAFVMLLSYRVYSQQDPLFSQYMFNKLALNPGYAGSRDALSVDLLYRYQWVNIDGAPKTISASVHSPLRNPRLGLGLTAYNDQIGPLTFTKAFGSFSYKILFDNSTLSFGLQMGFSHSYLDKSKLKVYDEGDILILYDQTRQFIPDANFGIYYYSDRYYLGLSSKQLFGNTALTITDKNSNTQFYKLVNHFYGIAGLAIPLSDNLVFRPSALAKYAPNAPLQVDLNASFLINNIFWIGASYRTEKAVSFITEINLTENLRLGYSYDIWLNELKVLNKGSHEIRLGYDFNLYNSRMRTPRYF